MTASKHRRPGLRPAYGWTPDSAPIHPAMHINDLLKIAVASGASDLHLKVGSYPMMRSMARSWSPSEEKRLERTDTSRMAATRSSPGHLEKFRTTQEVDLAYSVTGSGASAATSTNSAARIGLVLRVIPTRVKPIDELGAAAGFEEDRRRKSAASSSSPAPPAAARARRSRR